MKVAVARLSLSLGVSGAWARASGIRRRQERVETKRTMPKNAIRYVYACAS